MSSVPNSAVETESAASNLAKPERMLTGFPWVSAIVLYTLSWGWSLLRPNTLYWDDWSTFWQKDFGEILSIVNSAGLPPWSKVIESVFLQIGVWMVTTSTALVFFGTGLIVFAILRMLPIKSQSQKGLAILAFLIAPVNHARVSLIIFDYTTSYFLFYLGWFVLVRYKSIKSFVLACVILFLSFKTHSFLFFALLPFLHFCWLNKIGRAHV